MPRRVYPTYLVLVKARAECAKKAWEREPLQAYSIAAVKTTVDCSKFCIFRSTVSATGLVLSKGIGHSLTLTHRRNVIFLFCLTLLRVTAVHSCSSPRPVSSYRQCKLARRGAAFDTAVSRTKTSFPLPPPQACTLHRNACYNSIWEKHDHRHENNSVLSLCPHILLSLPLRDNIPRNVSEGDDPNLS